MNIYVYITTVETTNLVPLFKVAWPHARHSCPESEQVGMICCSLMIRAPSFDVPSGIKSVLLLANKSLYAKIGSTYVAMKEIAYTVK